MEKLKKSRVVTTKKDRESLPPIVSEYLFRMENDTEPLDARLRYRDNLKNIANVTYHAVKSFDEKLKLKSK